MKLSDRYVLSELLMPFFTSVFAVVMMLVGNTLYAILDRMLQEKWPLDAVFRMLVLNIPVVLVMGIPVGMALAAALAVNRMARDQEMTTLRAAGQPLWRTFMPIFGFGVFATFGTFYLNEKVVPWSFKEQRNVEAILKSLPKNPIKGGKSFSVDDYFISFNAVQTGKTEKQFLFHKIIVLYNPNRFPGQDDGEFATIQMADNATYENGVFTLPSSRTYRFNADGTLALIARGDESIPLRIDFSTLYNPPDDWAMTQQSYADLTQLQLEAERQKRFKDALGFQVNRWFKLTLPLMCFSFSLCAPPLTLRFARTGAFTGVLLSIMVVFVGWNTLLLMKGVALGGYVSPLLAAVSTPIIFALFGIWLLRVQE